MTSRKILADIPNHIAIIMDGNGRWAAQRGMARSEGHQYGLKTARKIAKHAASIGLNYLSYYVFSTENWKRSEEEINFLFDLLKRYLREELSFCLKNNIRIFHSGDLFSLPLSVKKEIEYICHETSEMTGLSINLAINYGGQDEIIRAFNRFLESSESEKLSSKLRKQDFFRYLDLPMFPPVDLIIRTSGEQRLSNFLLWQSAYAELIFSPKYWPDWEEQDLNESILSYQSRSRRFGGY